MISQSRLSRPATGSVKSAPSESLKVGRNQPCPCGSGKKYKRCCLSSGSHVSRADSALRQAAVMLREAAQRHRRGDLTGAIRLYEQVLLLAPNQADALHLLGMIRFERGEPRQALELIRRAVRADATNVAYHMHLGMILRAQGELSAAVEANRRAVEVGPDNPRAHYNLGLALQAAGCDEDALAAYRSALELTPDNKSAHKNLGVLLRRRGEPRASLESLKRALVLDPADGETLSNIGGAYKDLGQQEQAVGAYREALRLTPGSATIHSNLLFALNYSGGITPAELLAEHRQWDRIHGSGEMPPRRLAGRGRRALRVGYVSSDFRKHAVGFFIEPLITGHRSSGAISCYCYSDVPQRDEITERIATEAHHFREIYRLTDDEVMAQIDRDEIDILVDLAGHTAGNRLSLFARRAAPVQVTYLGYPNTTGVAAMDYRLTDEIADPVGVADDHHSERLIRLPNGFLCYRPPPAPDVSPTSGRDGRGITFGSFNNLAKVTGEVVDLWATLLRAAPTSRLLIKSRALAEPASRRELIGWFERRGVSPERVLAAGHTPSQAEHLALYSEVDIALDTFPYNGTTTTCEALWMGVPVITLKGDRHASRVGASILQPLGLDRLVADGPRRYLEVATALAADVEQLNRLRSTLRDRVRSGALTDSDLITGDLESAYLSMFDRSCRPLEAADPGRSDCTK